MKENEYFIINSIEELKKAYEMFEDKWDTKYPLEKEIMDFNEGFRYVRCTFFGMYLVSGKLISYYTEIPSPVRNINNLNKLI